ncbi:MAG: O-antigen ligase family protein [Clostridiales bacterium]|jgi:O-antigen ligase|nr:O-antigen ligase family protein [Clostridiales bacterium]
MIPELIQNCIKSVQSLYNQSIIGNCLTSAQVKTRAAFDSSALGGACYNNSAAAAIDDSLIVRGVSKTVDTITQKIRVSKLPSFLQDSTLFWLFTRFEIFFFALIFLAPFIPTMACVALAVASIVSLICRVIAFGNPSNNIADSASKSATKHSKFLGLSGVDWLVALFIVVSGIYAITSLATTSAIKVWLIYAAFIGMYFVAIKTINSPKRLLWACTTFVTSGLIVALYGVYQQYFGNNLGHAWLDESMFTGISVRVYSTLGNPNVLGEYLLLTIPLAAALFWWVKKPIPKIFFLGALGVMLLCMIFTQSRGCWLALILTVMVFILFIDKRYFALLPLALCIAPFVLPQSIIERFTSIGNLSDTSTSYRVMIWLGTIAMLKDYWFMGVGLSSAAFALIYPFYSYSMIIAPHAHNIYLEVMAEMSVFTLILLISIIIVYCLQLLNAYLKTKPITSTGGVHKKSFKAIIIVAIVSGFLGFMMQGAFDYVWYNYRVFLMFWIFLGLGIAATRQVED